VHQSALTETNQPTPLAYRFTRMVGPAPMHYLANWRMQVAAHDLRNTSASLAQVAERIGYDSEAAFSRGFKKAFGTAPATWRRQGATASVAHGTS
jgi:AraC-like DNA-binding protein